MARAIFGFEVEIRLPDDPVTGRMGPELVWHVSGEENVDVLCKILRRNGIRSYAVAPANDIPYHAYQTLPLMQQSVEEEN